MTRNEILRRWPRASDAMIKANLSTPNEDHKNPYPVQAPVMEHRHAPALHGPKPKKEDSQGRIVVRIKSIRKRLIDPDNIHCKDIIDGLRDLKLIPDDSAKYITLEVSQEKGEQDQTEVTIIYP